MAKMPNIVGVILLFLILVLDLPQSWGAKDIETGSFTESLSKLHQTAPFQPLAAPRTAAKFPGIADIIPGNLGILLPMAFGDACTNDLNRSLSNLNEDWARRMLDADGKPASGLMEGNVLWPGDYYECRKIRAPPFNTSKAFTGQYCQFSWNVTINTTWNMPIKTGLCVPSTCNEGQLIKLTNLALLFVRPSLKKLGPVDLQVLGVSCKRDKPFDSAAIGTTCLLSVFALLVLVGTSLSVVDFIKARMASSTSYGPIDENVKNEQIASGLSEPAVKKFLKCFSILANGSKILATDGSGDLRCIHGIRFLSMTWVILGHTYMFSITSGVSRSILQILDRFDNLAFEAIMQGTLSVDTFFLLSGFLLCYLFLKEAKLKDGKISWLLFYCHRIWRLTPVFAIVLAFNTTLAVYMADGPFWPNDSTDPNCKRMWWWNLLYINNFLKQTESCMGWSWYLANDMQFYVISPIFLYLLWRRPKIGLSIVCALLVSSWVATGIISYHYDLPPGYILPSNLRLAAQRQVQQSFVTGFEKAYIRPYTRIGPYLIGVILGYIISCDTSRESKKSLSKLAQCLGWVVAASTSLAVVYGLYHRDPGPIAISVYNALGRSIFAAAVSWMIYSCLTGNAGVIDGILSCKSMIPLSRLTYCAYLVHPIIINGYYQSLPELISVTHANMVTIFLGLLVMSYATAFVCSLVFESPMMAIEKQLLSALRKRSSKQLQENNRPISTTSVNCDIHQTDQNTPTEQNISQNALST